ncbi:MAG: stage II sporulation protein M [Clostridiales bacterium]|jgi:hypothetical protein|nr:stage II sporulation protein M [Clostridiales bacterium]
MSSLKKLKKTDIFIIICAIACVAGVFAGSLSCRGYKNVSFDFSSGVYFVESFVKHIKIPIIIWFFAFLPYAALAAVPLLFFKGFSVGAGVALILAGGGNIISVFFTTGIQNLILIPAYIFISRESFDYSGKFRSYIRALLVCIICAAAVAFYESYLLKRIVL